jgi:hypothetical protein
MLLLAETLWSSLESEAIAANNDYSVVGVQFRRAIEHVWKKALANMPGVDTNGTLGKLLVSLLDLTAIGRGVLAGRLGNNSPLLNGPFLRGVLDLSIRFLNPAAHARGLTQATCMNLREELLDRGWLRRILEATRAPQ